MNDLLHVLVIEDNLGDFHLLEESFEEQRIPARLYHASDAVRAFAFLAQQAPFDRVPTPDLILLDLNLPSINGRQILEVIRGTREWAKLPVIVLSSSSLKSDQDEAARLGIEAYMVKPAHFDGYLELAARLGDTCRSMAARNRRRQTASLRTTPSRPQPAAAPESARISM